MVQMEEELKTQLNKEDVKRYIKDLKTGDTKARAVAAYMLGITGEKDKRIRRVLTKALTDDNWEVRKWAALSLGEIGEKDSKLIPILIDVMKRDDSKEFRSHAAIILGEFKKRAASALPALQDATRDDNTRVREWANWAVNKIAGETTNFRVNYPAERPKLSDRLRFAEKDSD